MISSSKLRDFEDEQFYSVLDVALDIKVDLDFGASEIFLPANKKLVKYSFVLMPAATPSLINRYCELRLKALHFLKKETYLTEVDDQRNYWADDGGQFCVTVRDESTFISLVEMLKNEEERRGLGSSRAHAQSDALSHLEQVCDAFHRSVLRLRSRHDNREPFEITDEYDVQDLLWALLETRFSDIRDEEPTPSHAGKAARADFLLRTEEIIVETKMTRDGLNDGTLGDQLIRDIERYRKHPHCKALFCFVYDPEHRLKNPLGLERDLSGNREGLPVRVQIRPRR